MGDKVEPTGGGTGAEDDPVLARALAMSVGESGAGTAESKSDVNLDAMTEDEQIEYAMRMSMAQEAAEKMDVDEQKGDEDYSEAMNDPAFLQSVLESLPGVDPQSDAVRQAVGAMSRSGTDNTKKEDSEKKDDKSKK